MGESSQLHWLYPQEWTRYPLCRRLSGPQSRCGRVRKISPPTGIPSPDHPAHSESLYPLSYAGPPPYSCVIHFNIILILTCRSPSWSVPLRFVCISHLLLLPHLTAIVLSPGGSSTAHIYTQTILRTIQNKQYTEQHNNFGRVRSVPRIG